MLFSEQPIEVFNNFNVESLPLFWLTKIKDFNCDVIKVFNFDVMKEKNINSNKKYFGYFSMFKGIILASNNISTWYHELGHYLDFNLWSKSGLDKISKYIASQKRGSWEVLYTSRLYGQASIVVNHNICYYEQVAEIFSSYIRYNQGIDIRESINYVNTLYVDDETLNYAFETVAYLLNFLESKKAERICDKSIEYLIQEKKAIGV